jgi:hypothetical protein
MVLEFLVVIIDGLYQNFWLVVGFLWAKVYGCDV